MSIRDRNRGTEVLDDFDPVEIVANANKKAEQAEAPAPRTPAPRRKRKPKVDPWQRVPFNSKVPRWIRSATRAFADEENQDLQDLHAAALIVLMHASGFDVGAYVPDTKVSPVPKHAEALTKLIADYYATLDGDEEAEISEKAS
ncbi:MAG: hypothetical protein ACRDRD_11175 [Pseudonocardiaceae bacterium]